MLQSRRKPQYLEKGDTHTYHPIQLRNVTSGHKLEGSEGFCPGKDLHTNAPSSFTHGSPHTENPSETTKGTWIGRSRYTVPYNSMQKLKGS